MPQLAVSSTAEYTRVPIKKAAPKNIPGVLQTSGQRNGNVSPRPQPVVSPKVSPKPAPPKVQPKPPAAATSPGKQQAKALYDFDAENEDELAFKEGEVISVIDKSNNDWWEGEIGSRRGLFPGLYVQIIDGPRPAKATPRPPGLTGKPQPKPGAVKPGAVKNPGIPMPKFGPKPPGVTGGRGV